MGRHAGGEARRHGRRNHVAQGMSSGDVMTPLSKPIMVRKDGKKQRAEDQARHNPQLRIQLYILLAIMAPFLALLLSLWLAHSTSAGPTSKRQASASCDEAALNALLPDGASVERVDNFPNGTASYNDAFNPGYPFDAQNVPPVCAVTVRVIAPENSDYRFGLFLPAEANWTGDFIAVGNYAQAGGINWADMGTVVNYGMATMSTDTGHISIGSTLAWALDRDRGALLDWGYRAVNGSIHIAKDLTRAYYASSNKPFGKSYWSGCSTGGRQGLKQIQISPDSLDGLLIGAPAWDTKHLFPWIAHISSLFFPLGSPGYLDNSTLLLTTAYLYGICDPQDSPAGFTGDGTVSWPEECRFNLNNIRCTSQGQTNCLTDAQIQTVLALHQPYRVPATNTTIAFPGAPPVAEITNPYISSDLALLTFPLQYFRYFLYPDQAEDPRWADGNLTYFLNNQATILQDSERLNPGQATADNFNLNAFRNRGGKIIMYHGTKDSVVPTGSTARFYSSVLRETTSNNPATMDEFFKLFYVPGMGHCMPDNMTETLVPWDIGGAMQQYSLPPQYSVPNHLFDSQHDALQALLEWVEGGRNPSNITAVAYNGTGNSLPESFSRPLCAFPKRAVYSLTRLGDYRNATAWDCVIPSLS